MNRGLLANRKTSKLWTLTKVVSVLLLGILLGVIAAVAMGGVYKRSLIDRARTATQAVEVSSLSQLSGSEADLLKPQYKVLKEHMQALHQLNRDSRFVYVMAQHNNDVYFVADSEPPTSEDYSPPGQVFDEASPELRSIFTEGNDVVEGPIRDRWGIWLSALTPMKDPKTNKVVALLGIDVPAKEYLTVLGAVAALPISVAIVAATIIGAVDVARRRHQESVEMQAELVSVITHELNNPLTGIRWGAELLLSSYYQEGPSANVTKAIYSSVRKLQESVDDVLEIARLGRTAQPLDMQPVAVTSLIQEIFDTQKLPAEHKRVGLQFDASWPKDLTLMCDANKMKRIFNNLISNAIKYTRQDTKVTVLYAHEAGKHCITIKDEGIGIPEAEQEKVFSGFYRATNAVKSGERGTGMGLFLVRKSVLQQGGDLHLASIENQGTSVTIKMPDALPVLPVEPDVTDAPAA